MMAGPAAAHDTIPTKTAFSLRLARLEIFPSPLVETRLRKNSQFAMRNVGSNTTFGTGQECVSCWILHQAFFSSCVLLAGFFHDCTVQ
jgi:hypothetical protein